MNWFVNENPGVPGEWTMHTVRRENIPTNLRDGEGAVLDSWIGNINHEHSDKGINIVTIRGADTELLFPAHVDIVGDSAVDYGPLNVKLYINAIRSGKRIKLVRNYRVAYSAPSLRIPPGRGLVPPFIEQLEKRWIDPYIKRTFGNPVPFTADETYLIHQWARIGIHNHDVILLHTETDRSKPTFGSSIPTYLYNNVVQRFILQDPTGITILKLPGDEGPEGSDKYTNRSNKAAGWDIFPVLGVDILPDGRRREFMIRPVQQLNVQCSVCDEPALHMCSACKATTYCGKKCQSKHWKDHSKECNTK